MDTPLVSVIIPAFNMERYIETCVTSVRRQSYHNLEIIVVNDGSSDRTVEIVQGMQEEDPRIKLVSQNNRGLGPSRNAGLSHAQGDYVFFLDGDDGIHFQTIDLLVTAMLADEVGSRVAIVDCVYADDVPLQQEPLSEPLQVSLIPQIEAYEWLCFKNIGRWVTSCWKLFDRTLFDSVHFPDDHRLYEDTYIAHLLYGQTPYVVQLDACLYYYRQRPDSIMGRYGLKKYDHLYAAWMQRALFFKDRGFADLYHRQCRYIEEQLRADYEECEENEDEEGMGMLAALHRQYFKENFASLSSEQKVKRLVKCAIGRV